MTDIRLKLREAILDHTKAVQLEAQIQQQLSRVQRSLVKVEGARDALAEVWLDGKGITLQEAWDQNFRELREDDGVNDGTGPDAESMDAD